MPPSCAPGDARRVRHRLHAGVEQHHAVAVADEVDVHRLAREAAAQEPDAVGDLIGPARAELRRGLRLGVEGALHRQLLLGPVRRHQAELAGDGHRVGVRVVLDDQAVADDQDVRALEVEPRAVGLDALERRARERAARLPAVGGAVVLHGLLDDREDEVGERPEEPGEERAHALGRRRVDLSAHVLAATRPPHRDRRLDVVIGDRGEVGVGDALGLLGVDRTFGDAGGLHIGHDWLLV